MRKEQLTAITLAIFCTYACGSDAKNDEPCVLDVDAPITEPTTWDCPTVNVLRNISVQDHLTIEPGTDVVVAANAAIAVEGQGALTAHGTEDEKITFRGAEATKGHWGGIAIFTKSQENVFLQVEISDTGSGNARGEDAALFIGGDSTPEGFADVEGVTFRNMSGKGLALWKGARLHEDSDVWNFEDVDGPPVSVTFDNAHQIGLNQNFDGEIPKKWYEVGTGTLNEEVAWQSDAAPYRIVNRVIMGDDAWLTIDAKQVEFAQDLYLSTGKGRLTIGGDAPVLLTGVEKIPGYWGGIAFESISEANTIIDATIEFAGGKNGYGESTAVLVGGGSSPVGSVAITGSVIRASQDMGIKIRSGGRATLENVTYEDNGGQDVVDENN